MGARGFHQSPNPTANDGFGTTLAISGRLLGVGAPYEDSAGAGNMADDSRVDAGAVYVLELTATSVLPTQTFVKASNPDEHDAFGSAIGFSKETLVVGAPFEDSVGTGWNGVSGNGSVDTGAVYAFR